MVRQSVYPNRDVLYSRIHNPLPESGERNPRGGCDALVVVAAVSGFPFARQNITVKIQAARRQTVDALLAYYGRHGVTMAQHHDLPAGQGNVCFPRDDETREVYWRCTACNVRGRPTLDAQQTVADGWSHFLRKHPAATR